MEETAIEIAVKAMSKHTVRISWLTFVLAIVFAVYVDRRVASWERHMQTCWTLDEEVDKYYVDQASNPNLHLTDPRDVAKKRVEQEQLTFKASYEHP